MSDVVTGDAVVVEVQIAQLPVRAVGALIDVTAIFILYLIGVLLAAMTFQQFDDALIAAFLIIFMVLALVGYPVIFETATRGRSLGKMAMGLRVVSDDGGPERFRQALFRALASVVEILVFCRRARGDLQHAVVERQTNRRRIRGHGGDQRTWAEAGAAAGDASIAGLVGVVAAAVRPEAGDCTAGSSIPLARYAIATPGARSDGIPDHR